MIKKILMKVFQIKKLCDDCNGELEYTGQSLTTYPALYPHECKDCKRRYTFDKMYPALEYEEDSHDEGILERI
jgi:hypothetical protein